jgi:hypothetical protein
MLTFITAYYFYNLYLFFHLFFERSLPLIAVSDYKVQGLNFALPELSNP